MCWVKKLVFLILVDLAFFSVSHFHDGTSILHCLSFVLSLDTNAILLVDWSNNVSGLKNWCYSSSLILVKLAFFSVSHLWQQLTQMQHSWFIGPIMCQVMKLVLLDHISHLSYWKYSWWNYNVAFFIVSHLWQQFMQMQQSWFIGTIICQVKKLVLVDLTFFRVSHLWQQLTQMQYSWFIGPIMCR